MEFWAIFLASRAGKAAEEAQGFSFDVVGIRGDDVPSSQGGANSGDPGRAGAQGVTQAAPRGFGGVGEGVAVAIDISANLL